MRKFYLLLFVMVLLAGCSGEQANEKATKSSEFKSSANLDEEAEEAGEQFKNVSVEEAEAMIAAGEVHIIDVRSNEMYAEGHLKGAENIPLKELEAKQANLNKEKPYLIVCKTGKTSETASKQLTQSGFKQISNLTLGMDAWDGEVVK